MALIIEDGTNISNANSLVTLSEADAYFTARAITTWTGTDSAKQAALIRAMQYLNGLSWQGLPVVYNQPLAWPRCYVNLPSGDYWPQGEIPKQVKDAQCEIALRWLIGEDLTPDMDPGGQIIRERIEGAMEIEYAPGGSNGKRVQSAERLLIPFLYSMGANISMVRS